MRVLALILVLAMGCLAARSQAAVPGVPERCPRPAPGSVVQEPEDLRSRNGVLSVDLSIRNQTEKDGSVRYCYVLPDGQESPTLRVKPGDLVVLRLRNELVPVKASAMPSPAHRQGAGHRGSDPCTRGLMSATSTNLHFHGLTIPPVCHQDDVLRTSILPDDPPFEYRFRIPQDEPPGLYWYHPHIHGFSALQVGGGASGAFIVEGIQRANPEVAGLPERVLVIRDQPLVNPGAAPGGSARQSQVFVDSEGDALNNGTGTGPPARDLSINFAPVPYPGYPPASILMRPGARELWRVVNASSVTYLDLAVQVRRGPAYRPQWLGIVAIDGVPLNAAGSPGHATEWRNSLFVPPGARVEFIMVGPPVGASAVLVTRWVDTGPVGDNDPNRPLAAIIASPDAPEPPSRLPTSTEPLPPPARPWLGTVTPTRVRRLYFSEDPPDPSKPGSERRFYITVEGHKPQVFDPAASQPDITVTQGDVEDWIIENRSRERHTFHIHQLHFELVDWLGLPVHEPYLRDTIDVPYYTPSMKSYPSVRLRMDFRDPSIVGTFVYHCHILDHEDGGMMGRIRVVGREPPAAASASSPPHLAARAP